MIKYATLFPGGFYGSAFGFFMNEDKWNKLSKQDQDVIKTFRARRRAARDGKAWDTADKVGLDALKEAGANIVDATPAMIAEAKKRSGRSSRTGSRRPAPRASTPRRSSTSSTRNSRRSQPESRHRTPTKGAW